LGWILKPIKMNQRVTQENYHDYVIKDGFFIGDFQNMYRNCEDPWMQSKQPNKYARFAGIQHIKNYHIKSVLECGCGLGYYADWIFRDTGIVPKGIDISEEAIAKATQLFPHLDFSVANVTADLKMHTDLDCILLSEIIWYILPDLDTLFSIMQSEFKGKYLLINQVFYKGTQRYGVEYFTSLSELISYVPFELLGRCEATLAQDSTIETSTIFKIS
jgi:SAM-dependent methyltransferase